MLNPHDSFHHMYEEESITDVYGVPQSARRHTSGNSAAGSLYGSDLEMRDRVKHFSEADVPEVRSGRRYSDSPSVHFPSPGKGPSGLSLCFSPQEVRSAGLPLEIGCK
jgi:hypothetical protein